MPCLASSRRRSCLPSRVNALLMRNAYEARDYDCEPCWDRGRRTPAELFVGQPSTPMCKACAFGLPHPQAKGGTSAGTCADLGECAIPG
jgi:hypothetical protein